MALTSLIAYAIFSDVNPAPPKEDAAPVSILENIFCPCIPDNQAFANALWHIRSELLVHIISTTGLLFVLIMTIQMY